MRSTPVLLVAAVAAALGPALAAHAANDVFKCRVGRIKAAGKFTACVQKNLSRDGLISSTMIEQNIARCRQKWEASWANLGKSAPTSTCAQTRLVDNGDGTLTDRMTHLQWELKTGDDGAANLADPHDVDNVYSWSTGVPATTLANGTIFTSFLPALNTACFAGNCDWRLPTFVELMTLLQPALCGGSPSCIDPMFGPTGDGHYSSTTRSDDGPGTSTWSTEFNAGTIFSYFNTSGAHIRAVREGY
jgi:hypothetical protein